ncbi:speckle-type POZ protein-like [Microplitis mediator]|uniref:speckle-type POZ protein-like n=1 Tax=Microplitis mediator TaxID=375433 RepID=UPI0025533F0E|nr:speckle-type POZ protein-like [Microplitis mediator]
MSVKVITGEETMSVNYLWEVGNLNRLKLGTREIKSPVFEVSEGGSENKWHFLLSFTGDCLLIDLNFRSSCKRGIQYSYYVRDSEDKVGDKDKFECVHKGWGSGEFITRQGSVVMNKFFGSLVIFCQVVLKLNVDRDDELVVPRCQLIDELNFLFGIKNNEVAGKVKDNSQIEFFRDGKKFGAEIDDKKNSENVEIELSADLHDKDIDLPEKYSKIDSLKAMCQDFIYENIHMYDIIDVFTVAETSNAGVLKSYAIEFIDKNIDQVLDVTSFEEIQIKNPRLAVTLLRGAADKVNEFEKNLNTFKKFLHVH